VTVAVTGASGQLGRQVAELLLDRLDPSEVVLVTRTPDALSDLAARGADVRQGDFDEPEQLTGALAGVDRLLLISTDIIGTRVPQHLRAIEAAKAAGVGHVAYTSIGRPDEGNPSAVAPEHRATEQALRESGLAWTFLRNNLYSEFQVPVAGQALASGQLVTNAGDGRTAYVARTDCAAAAVAVLTGDGHERRSYDITGPEALGADDVARIVTELTGTPIEVVRVDDDTLVAGIVANAGLPEPVARTIASFGAATREGWLDGVDDALERLTGRAPRTLRDVLAEAGVGAAG
jgi:NAD(P)H dehydrogenase (quinone)